jgi:hypothetical protein
MSVVWLNVQLKNMRFKWEANRPVFGWKAENYFRQIEVVRYLEKDEL